MYDDLTIWKIVQAIRWGIVAAFVYGYFFDITHVLVLLAVMAALGALLALVYFAVRVYEVWQTAHGDTVSMWERHSAENTLTFLMFCAFAIPVFMGLGFLWNWWAAVFLTILAVCVFVFTMASIEASLHAKRKRRTQLANL